MGQFNDCPQGATHADMRGVTILRPNGWRKSSPALAYATALAQDGATRGIPKGRAIIAVKKVGAHIGLKAADLLLLDTLAAFSKPQDWEEGARPIVWPSNGYLMEQTGFSLSSLKRHARRLAEQGVLTFRDSPNGKRWGQRDEQGAIIEAYGFDLTPLSTRTEEFEELSQHLSHERLMCQRLKRQITIARRNIRTKLETALSEGMQAHVLETLQSAFNGLLAHLPRPNTSSDRLNEVNQGFCDLAEHVDSVLTALHKDALPNCEPVSSCVKLDPTGTKSDPNIPTTNQHQTVSNNTYEADPLKTAVPEEGLEKKKNKPDLAVILRACPEFTTWAESLGAYVKTWRDLDRVAGQLGPMIGISEPAWAQAQAHMGRSTASAALALVFEKAQSGDVSSPSGYLSGMVRKFRAGELHLERSFFGRLSQAAA